MYDEEYERKKKRKPFDLESIIELYTLQFKDTKIELSLRGHYETPYLHKVTYDKDKKIIDYKVFYHDKVYTLFNILKNKYDKQFDQEYHNQYVTSK